VNILLVDDEPQIIELFGRFLDHCGYHVITATDGAQAVEILEQQSVDLVLSDLRMPNLDGVQLLEIVAERWENIPFILMTGHEDPDISTTALQAGARECMKKPVRLADLRGKLAEFDSGTEPE
jgi:CheY-like chemotaxis protein